MAYEREGNWESTLSQERRGKPQRMEGSPSVIKPVEDTNTTIAHGRGAVPNRSHRKEKLESQGREPKPRRKGTAGERKALLRSYEQKLEEVAVEKRFETSREGVTGPSSCVCPSVPFEHVSELSSTPLL